MSRPVHLVGSIGLDTVDEVFTTVGRLLGPYLKRVPDGEVGGRRMWISWQAPVLRANPFLQVDSSSPQLSDFAPLRIADAVDGVGPFSRADFPHVFRAYKRARLDELARICDAIPHEHLSVQWDIAQDDHLRWAMAGAVRNVAPLSRHG